MNISDVIQLIKACGECGVTEVKFRGLHAKFQTVKAEYTVHMPVDSDKNDPQLDNDGKMSTLNTESIEKQEIIAKEEELAMMAIEDPLQYEALLASDELEDSKLGEIDVQT